MTQIQNITTNTTDSIQQSENAQTVSYDDIVGNLIHQGLPQAFNPNNYLSKIADTYSISLKDARTCLKLAIAELETQKAQEKTKTAEAKNTDKPFAQSGYYYPSQGITITSAKNDGMDNLNSYGSYNRLMFGIK